MAQFPFPREDFSFQDLTVQIEKWNVLLTKRKTPRAFLLRVYLFVTDIFSTSQMSWSKPKVYEIIFWKFWKPWECGLQSNSQNLETNINMLISRLRDSVQWARVSFRGNFWDLEKFGKSQIPNLTHLVLDQGLAAFIIANNLGLAAFIIANKHALWVNFYIKHCTGTESVHNRKLTSLLRETRKQVGLLFKLFSSDTHRWGFWARTKNYAVKSTISRQE